MEPEVQPFFPDRLLHSHRFFAHIEHNLCRNSPVLSPDGEQILAHPPHQILLVSALEFKVKQAAIRQRTQQIHPRIAHFR